MVIEAKVIAHGLCIADPMRLLRVAVVFPPCQRHTEHNGLSFRVGTCECVCNNRVLLQGVSEVPVK